MYNKATLLGRIGQDIELKTTKAGSSLCEISLATSEKRKKGDEWEDHTEWHRVVFFGKSAENLDKFASKGSLLFVDGRIQTTEFETKEGQKVRQTKIICDTFKFVGGDKKEEGGSKRVEKKPTAKKESSDYGGYNDGYDGDIPF